MTDRESRILLQQVCSGDEEAARQLFDRFVDRMINLTRSRLSPQVIQRFDPEDVVQSAYRSFFRNARAGRYELLQSGDLWRLLAAITINKVRTHVKRHKAQRRAVTSEQVSPGHDSLWGIPPAAVARSPTPEEAAALTEETHQMMRRLSPLYRRVLELQLQGNTVEETAIRARCAERTVRRAMETAKRDLEERLLEIATP